MSGPAAALAILAKDVRLELRRVESLATMAVFAGLVVVIFAFVGDPTPADLARIGPGALWASILFAGALENMFRPRIEGFFRRRAEARAAGEPAPAA